MMKMLHNITQPMYEDYVTGHIKKKDDMVNIRKNYSFVRLKDVCIACLTARRC